MESQGGSSRNLLFGKASKTYRQEAIYACDLARKNQKSSSANTTRYDM